MNSAVKHENWDGLAQVAFNTENVDSEYIHMSRS